MGEVETSLVLENTDLRDNSVRCSMAILGEEETGCIQAIWAGKPPKLPCTKEPINANRAKDTKSIYALSPLMYRSLLVLNQMILFQNQVPLGKLLLVGFSCILEDLIGAFSDFEKYVLCQRKWHESNSQMI